MKKNVTLGIDQLDAFLKKKSSKGRKINVGALCHPSSASRQFQHLITILESRVNLVAIFGPQHGIHGETQDNMIEWQDTRDEKGRPVYSLYGERRKPNPESLKNVELMVIDLFDVGARYYTFIYTMFYMMEACADAGIPILICDRPNPLGGQLIEGPILNPNYRSFVGLHEIPVCHGMTVGELARLFASFLTKDCQIEILKMKGWKRSMHWPETGLTWTLPSPNMPSYQTALLYPGMCLLEGTSLSEGRGTTRPFELIGAPFFDWTKIEKDYLAICKRLKLHPATLHRQGFIPTFHKFSGSLCRGAIQFVEKPKAFWPLRHMTVLLWVFRRLYGSQWSWKEPPYEYEYEKLPIDILAGGPGLREVVDGGTDLRDLFNAWSVDEERFKKLRRPHLIY
jgi:uncharacterized protein YbbC (DUF1343 family)